MKKIISIFLIGMLLTSCATDKTVATVGNTKIKSGEFEFYLSSIKKQLSGTELQTEEDWQTKEIEGKKAIEVAKQRALDIAIENAEYSEVAKKVGLSFTKEDKENVEATKKQVITSYGGDEKYKAFLKENKIDDGFIQMMCESTAYYSKIKSKLQQEEQLTDNDILAYYNDNKESVEAEYRKAKHILFLTQDVSTGTEFSQEKQAEVKELADSVLARVNAGEDFDALMNEYSEDTGLKTNPDGYVFGSGEMVSEFEQAVDSVGYNEVTICKSTYGYHIIKRLPITFEEVKDKLNNKVWDEKISNKVKEWEKEYNIVIKINDDILKEIN